MAAQGSYEEVVRRLEALAGQAPGIALDVAELAMPQALYILHGALPDYPDVLPGQVYRRTQTLRKRFTEQVERTESEVIGEIGTNLAYAPWVVGPDFPGQEIGGIVAYQAKVHQKRWWQFDVVIEGAVNGAWEEFDKAFWPEFSRRIKEL